MKDAASIPQEFNPNYEERRKEFPPANARPVKQDKHSEPSRTKKADKHLPARHEEQGLPSDEETAPDEERK